MKEQEVKEVWTLCKYIFESGVTIEFPGYEVSDMGRIRSLRSGKAKIMKQCDNNNNTGRTIFHRLTLRKDNKRYQIATHRLVLSSFKESDYFPGAVADHIVARTETECCDRLDNLRWVTQQQNTTTEHCKELKAKALTNRKDQSKRVKVTVLSTGEVTEYPSAMEAGRSLGIHPGVPSMCISQHDGHYKKLGLHFEYID